MTLFVRKTGDALQLSRPPGPSLLIEPDFEPDQPCHQSGERVLSLVYDYSGRLPWYESKVNRP